MSNAAFTQLHVASSFSLRYGTTPPHALVEHAAELGYGRLALTDRDGLYGAVKFVEACRMQGIEPVLGVDLAVGGAPFARRRTQPVKGGLALDDGAARVTVLARGAASGLAPGRGWAALCRLVTEAHLNGDRQSAAITPQALGRHARGGGADSSNAAHLTVLLGPGSDVGEALRAKQHRCAERLLRRWRSVLPAGGLAIEVVCHGGPPESAASQAHAVALWRLALACGVPAVLTGWVRHATVDEAVTADVLDAARRKVTLHPRHLDRTTLGGHLRPEGEMLQVARDLARCLGDEGAAHRLVADTNRLAQLCVQHPLRDIGIGSVHLPEAEVLGLEGEPPQQVLTARCRAALAQRYGNAPVAEYVQAERRLEEELEVITTLGYPTYFLTVATVCDLIRDAGVRVAARGSGAGSLVNHLLGISGVDPMRYGLLMERFCTPLRVQLPDIDIDVESARRTEMYELIMKRFGGERVTCVSMAETYRVRHAIRDAGVVLGMPPADVDVIAKAFPHIAARDVRTAVEELPELRARGFGAGELDRLFDLVERLDGLPRHIALHPCGVVLSNAGLADRTPMEASWLGFPMSQFDKDDVETLGLLKLDVLGIRMQSAMAHAVGEVARVEGVRIDLDDEAQVCLDDEQTFELIRTTRTLGCFQIESPGQRELIGKLAPREFADLIIDISLFRPGPVKSDMINPFLRARHGWGEPEYLHESLRGALEETCGVVVFHEQVLRIVAETAGVSLAWADEVRRALGTAHGQERMEHWWRSAAEQRGYTAAECDRIWTVLAAFASFGFCKAHAAAFALPTYQSAWLKAHHPAAFVAGVLTHDPGMYPKRLMVSDARAFGIPVLGVDVNHSDGEYRVEKVGDLLGVRMGLCDVKGMSETEQRSLVVGQPYAGLVDFWNRAHVSRPVAERLVLVGAFDSMYGMATAPGRGHLTRRDLLLELADLEHRDGPGRHRRSVGSRARFDGDAVGAARRQAQGRRPGKIEKEPAAQLVLDLPHEATVASGLPELTPEERVRAELDILGIDVSRHVLTFYRPLLDHLGLARGVDLVEHCGGDQVWCAGIKVATQTPPVRSGRRVIFLSLDDGTNPVDATFFEDIQGPYAETVFHSWMLLVRGIVRRTGPRGVSLRATGAWDLSALWQAWTRGGPAAVDAAVHTSPDPHSELAAGVGGARGRRVLVHPSGYRQSPFADIQPAGAAASGSRVPLPGEGPAPRPLWHASPGSSGGWTE